MKHEKRTPEQEAALKAHIERTDALFADFKAKKIPYYEYTAACNDSFQQMKREQAVPS